MSWRTCVVVKQIQSNPTTPWFLLTHFVLHLIRVHLPVPACPIIRQLWPANTACSASISTDSNSIFDQLISCSKCIRFLMVTHQRTTWMNIHSLRSSRSWPCTKRVRRRFKPWDMLCLSEFSIRCVQTTYWLCFSCVYYLVHAVKVKWNVFWYEYTLFKKDEKSGFYGRFCFTCFSYITYDNRQVYRVCMITTLIARYMGPTWGRQDPGGPHVGPMNLAI